MSAARKIAICRDAYRNWDPWKKMLVELLSKNGLSSENVVEFCVDRNDMPDEKDLGPKCIDADFLLIDNITAAAITSHFYSKDCKLRFIQLYMAGANSLIDVVNKQDLGPVPVPIARLGGHYGPIMAEYVLGHIIVHEREIIRCVKEQAERVWNSQTYYNLRPLSTLTLGILGLGDIGKEVAQAGKAFGMTVWGLTRSPVAQEARSPHVDHYRQYDGLPELLSSSDYVCSILPSTPETSGLLDGDILKHCSAKKSVFINVGRGDVVDERTIVQAIREGWLGGAILDVFQKEPLPSSSELWNQPGVTISPHVASIVGQKETLEFFVAQIKQSLSNEPLQYLVDWEKGY